MADDRQRLFCFGRPGPNMHETYNDITYVLLDINLTNS